LRLRINEKEIAGALPEYAYKYRREILSMLPTFGFKSRNIALVYGGNFFHGLFFFWPIFALYVQHSLFTPANVALVIAVQSIVIALTQVPAGAFADLFGRRKTLLLGSILWPVSLVPLYIGGSIEMFFAYAILSAIASSLGSGAGSAILFDTLKEEKKEKQYKKVSGITSALWPLGAVIGSIIGGHMAAESLTLPVFASFLPAGVCVILMFLLKEPKYAKAKHSSVKLHLSESLKLVYTNRQILILIGAMFVLWGVGEATYNLGSIYFDFKQVTILFFGYIAAASFALSSLGSFFSHEVSEKFGNKNTLIISSVASPLLLIFSTILPGLFSAFAIVLSSLFFGLRNPVLNHMLNLEVASDKRATLNSIFSLVSNAGLAFFAILIGYAANIFDINAAFAIGGIVMLSVPILFIFLTNRN